ncbi:MAG: threonine/serine exporter family protein [Gemmatimonadaceae bacterium]|nr:threonine/serine exporter family protein [Gemmatimonadaceae bacterium]MCW5826891.1 threonine/serine exporter family protein [Gemmatimonadaceae bacterium]
MSAPLAEHRAGFDDRVRFLTELARRLHVVGVSASRLEGAVRSVALSIGVRAEIWSTPTGLLLSLSEAATPNATQETRVLRLEPGDIQLGALAKLDAISESVAAGTMSLTDAWDAMHALDRPVSIKQQLATVGAFGLAAAGVAGLLRTAWIDVSVAAVIGLVIGWLAILSNTRPHLSAAFEAVAALVATSLATAFAHFVAPLSLQTVIVAALIVLMPGLSLTTAVSELASNQLVTGTTRFAGALTVLLKLTFGSVAASQLMLAIGWTPMPGTPEALPKWVELIAMVAAAASFAVLFRASRRDIPLVMGSAILGYVLTRLGSGWLGPVATGTFAGSVFFSSLLMAALANLYGRLRGRPGTLVRVPGIMLLVPGSVGFRALSFVMEKDYTLGFDTLVAVLSAILALVAGLLFGSLLVPPRRHL